jgi:hypothetical protein
MLIDLVGDTVKLMAINLERRVTVGIPTIDCGAHGGSVIVQNA